MKRKKPKVLQLSKETIATLTDVWGGRSPGFSTTLPGCELTGCTFCVTLAGAGCAS